MTTIRILLFGIFLLGFNVTVVAGTVGDINNDGKIDLTEAIHALQVATGAYPSLDPSCQLVGKASWTASTDYAACDVVRINSIYYVCLSAHKASDDFLADAAYWELLTLPGNWQKSGDNLYFVSGNVGIGTNSPESPLEVSGTIHSTSGGIKFPDGTTQTTAAANGGSVDGNSLDAADGTPANAVFVDGDGNVGLGTVTPTAMLDVQAVVSPNVPFIQFEAGNPCEAEHWNDTCDGDRLNPYECSLGDNFSCEDVAGGDPEGYCEPEDLRSYRMLVCTSRDAANFNGKVTVKTLTISTGASAGHILMSDAAGNASWQSSDNDPANEIQTLNVSDTNLTLSNGGGTVSIADNDNSSANELNTSVTMSGSTLSVNDAGGAKSLNLAERLSTDNLSDVKSDSTSLFLGTGAGLADDGFNRANVGVGKAALRYNSSGSNNVAVGINSFYYHNTGQYNVGVGNNTNYLNETGSRNTIIGYGAGGAPDGVPGVASSGNVFLGYEAGRFENGSDLLYIDNSDTSFPLIRGDFAANALTINGTMDIAGNTAIGTGATVDSTKTLNVTGNGGNWAGYFNGDVEVTGKIKNNLKIDGVVEPAISPSISVYDCSDFGDPSNMSFVAASLCPAGHNSMQSCLSEAAGGTFCQYYTPAIPGFGCTHVSGPEMTTLLDNCGQTDIYFRVR